LPQAIAVPSALQNQQGEIIEKQTPTSGFGRIDWVVNRATRSRAKSSWTAFAPQRQ
jgi:hypothetical protein